jgi:hypothetical protein
MMVVGTSLRTYFTLPRIGSQRNLGRADYHEVATLRTLAERFIVDGLGEESFLNRPDVLPSGDLALRRATMDLYRLAQLPTERELLDIAGRWRPNRSVAAGYLFLSEFEAKR